MEQISELFSDVFWREILIAWAIFLVFLFFRNILVKYFIKVLRNIASRHRADISLNFIPCIENPLKVFLIFFGLYLSLTYLPLTPYQEVLVTKFFRGGIIAFIAWALYSVAGECLFEELTKRMDVEIDKILIPVITKALRFIIIALAISIIAKEWGYDFSSFIAGLGLGGLAISLAAKDALANIVGGIVVITDKPFTIGDWIHTPSVEGTVEDINFRSTKIRTFANSLVSAPNAILTNEPITNWTKMGKRRVTFHLGVTYDTPRVKLKNCVEKIKDLLENHPEIHKETIFVKFDRFNDSSLDIFIYFFTITTKWGDFLKVKEDINFNIMEILESEGVSVAFPSRSIYIENPVIYQENPSD